MALIFVILHLPLPVARSFFPTLASLSKRVYSTPFCSKIFAVTCSDSARGARSQIVITDECVLVKKKDYEEKEKEVNAKIIEMLNEEVDVNIIKISENDLDIDELTIKDLIVLDFMVADGEEKKE